MTAASAARVFISYRRADAQGWAGRLNADLAAAFGDGAGFFDLRSLAPGEDFRRAIARCIGQAKAVLVVIGPQWASMRDAGGRLRLEQADDVVAVEVEQALCSGLPVIPLLVGGAAMPAAAALPPQLRGLAALNALDLSDSRWEHDRDRLFAHLETLLGRRRSAAAATAVSVGAELQLEDAEVRKVTGVRARGVAEGLPAQVQVLDQAALKRVKIERITGLDLGPAAASQDD